MSVRRNQPHKSKYLAHLQAGKQAIPKDIKLDCSEIIMSKDIIETDARPS